MKNRTNIDVLDYMIPKLLRRLFREEPENVKTVKMDFTLVETDNQLYDLLYYIRPLGIKERDIDCSISLIKGEHTLLEEPTVRIYPEELSGFLRGHFSFMRDTCLDLIVSLFSELTGVNIYQSELSINGNLLAMRHADLAVVISKNS